MFKKQLLILLLIFWMQNSSCFLSELTAIVKKGRDLAKVLNDIFKTKDTATKIVSLVTSSDQHQDIIGRLNAINYRLDDLKSYMRDQQNYIALLIEQLPSELETQSKKDCLGSFILSANRLWDDLISYTRCNGSGTLFDYLVDDILGNLKSQLQEFRQVLTPLPGTITSEHHGLFMLLVKNADKKRDILCDQGETSHHSVVRLLYIVVITEIKAHILLLFAHLQKFSSDDGWGVLIETQFEEQLNRCFDTFSRSLEIAKLPYIRSCDPEIWQTNETYYGLYGYHQRLVFWRIGSRDRCNVRCENDNLAGIPCFPMHAESISQKSLMCRARVVNDHSKCEGEPFNCISVWNTFRDFFVCGWDEGPYKIRVIKEAGQIFGTDKEAMKHLAETNELICPERNAHIHRWYQRSSDTEYSCQCSESNVKILVMDMMSSRVDDNYVIVGLRIHHVKNYIYIQIAEGKIGANGHISDPSWVPSTRVVDQWNTESRSPPFIHVNEKIHSFFFGDVQLQPGFVLTGIQFGQRQTASLVRIVVRFSGHEFDYETGRLNPASISTHEVAREGDRELKFTTKTPINMQAHERSSPKSDGYTHVHLQISDTSDDYGQTTLPLLDGVPVLTNPLSPIGGVGLFYKGYAGDYAGFLSLRIYPINYNHFLESFKKMHDVNASYI